MVSFLFDRNTIINIDTKMEGHRVNIHGVYYIYIPVVLNRMLIIDSKILICSFVFKGSYIKLGN